MINGLELSEFSQKHYFVRFKSDNHCLTAGDSSTWIFLEIEQLLLLLNEVKLNFIGNIFLFFSII